MSSGLKKYVNMVHTEVVDALNSHWIVIPVGSIEQHGINLPLSVDFDIASKVVEMICKEEGHILAPGLEYGARSFPNSGGGDKFAGNVYLEGATYIKVIFEILMSYIRNGAKRILLLNGHYENYTYLCEAAQMAASQSLCNIVVINWWDILTVQFMKNITEEKFQNWEEEHAGIVETALEMYIRPYLVKGKECKEAGNEYKQIYSSHLDCVKSKSGALSSNCGATPEMGAIIFRKIIYETKKLMDTFSQMEKESKREAI